ncbi:MAG: DUF1707 domain-containing protein [Acidimicrobiales bacterium]
MGSGQSSKDNRSGKSSAQGAAWSDWLAKSVWYATSTRPGAQGGVPGPGRDYGPGSSVRASDAERSEVIDSLSQHFGEGRLDQEEFDDRLQRAMSAKTRGDLVPLLVDLPTTHTDASPTTPSVRQRLRRQVAGLAAAVSALVVLAVAWLVLAPGDGAKGWAIFFLLVAAYLLRRFSKSRRRRLRHEHLHEHGTPHWHGPHGRVRVEFDVRRLGSGSGRYDHH